MTLVKTVVEVYLQRDGLYRGVLIRARSNVNRDGGVNLGAKIADGEVH
jgi:hypothetical protein